MKNEITFTNNLVTSNIGTYGNHLIKGSNAFESAKQDIIAAGATAPMLKMDRFSENNVICSTIFDAICSKLPASEQHLAKATSKERKEMTETKRKKAEALNRKLRRGVMALITGALGDLEGVKDAEPEARGTKERTTTDIQEIRALVRMQKKRSNAKEPMERDVKIAAFWTRVTDEYIAEFGTAEQRKERNKK